MLLNIIRDTILYKPITVLSFLVSVRTFIYGLGFAIDSHEVRTLVVWEYIAETGLDPTLFGWFVIVISLMSILSLFFMSYKVTNYVFSAQALVWLYIAFCYFLNADIILGIVSGLTVCLFVGYLNFIFVQFSSVMPKRSRKSTPI